MPYTVEETSSLSRTASVSVPSEEYQTGVDKELRKLSGRVKIRGFRKGKVPMQVLRQRYGDAVQRDVIERLVRSYVDQILEDSEDVLYVDQPEVTAFGTDGVGLEFKVSFELRPKIDPIGYLGIQVDKPKVEVESNQIDEQLEGLRRQHSTLEPIELRTKIAEGDTVEFDFEALGDDEALADFKGSDVQITIGEGSILPGLEDALIGQAFDATVVAHVTPGDDYPNEELRGKAFDLQVAVKSVKKRVLPELDDDFAVDTGIAETLLELRQKVREDLAHRLEHDAGHYAENDLIERLLSSNDLELPPKFVMEQVDNSIRAELRRLGGQGVDLNTLNLDLASMREQMRSEKEEQLRAEFVLLAIAEKEKLEVTEQDLNAFFQHQSMHMNVPPDQLARYYAGDPSRKQQAVGSALLEKTVSFLLEKAEINEIDWPTPEEQQAKAEQRAEQKEQKAAKKAPAKAKGAKKAKAPAKAEEPVAAADDLRERLDAMKADDLKQLCRDNDLKVSGKKSDLVDRLVEAGVTL